MTTPAWVPMLLATSASFVAPGWAPSPPSSSRGTATCNESCISLGWLSGRCEEGSCRCTNTGFSCGDGVVDVGEVCDNGRENSDTFPDACRTDCRLLSVVAHAATLNLSGVAIKSIDPAGRSPVAVAPNRPLA